MTVKKDGKNYLLGGIGCDLKGGEYLGNGKMQSPEFIFYLLPLCNSTGTKLPKTNMQIYITNFVHFMARDVN